MACYLYILRSLQKETYYIGCSQNPSRRLQYHNAETKGYTRRYRPWKLVFQMKFDHLHQARQAEKKVKSWKSKPMIRRLIDQKLDLRNYLD